MSARAVTEVGQLASLASLALPWVSGEFGSWAMLSVLDLGSVLARVGPSYAGPAYLALVAYAIPLVALQGALIWPLAIALRLPSSAVRRVEVLFAAAFAVAAAAVGIAAGFDGRRSSFIHGPTFGVGVALLGSGLVLGATRLGARSDARTRAGRGAARS